MTRTREDFRTTTDLALGGAVVSAGGLASAGGFFNLIGGLLFRDPKAAFWLVTPINLIGLHVPFVNVLYAMALFIVIVTMVWMARGLVFGFLYVGVSVIAMYPYLRYGLGRYGMAEAERDAALWISLAYVTGYHLWLRHIFLNSRAYQKAIARIRRQTGLALAIEFGIRGMGGRGVIGLYDEAARTIAFASRDVALAVPLASTTRVSWDVTEGDDEYIQVDGVGPLNQTVRVLVRARAEVMANALEAQRRSAPVS